MYTALISTQELAPHLGDPNWVILDCRFNLAEPEQGEADYRQAHIPGAQYAHLDRDLSGAVIPGQTGRHPLPSIETVTQKFGKWGIGPGVQVVAYDAVGGALAAGRAWWILRWLGHRTAAVLDGGWPAWVAEGRPTQAGDEIRSHRTFTPVLQPGLAVGVAQVDQLRTEPSYRLFDARTAGRYRGKNETIDPVAGHIPGAHSAPYTYNLTPSGKFHPPEKLRRRYQALLRCAPPDRAVFYCGSGVTAVLNILAMEHAGLNGARLYPGSWSEWITDHSRPVETVSPAPDPRPQN